MHSDVDQFVRNCLHCLTTRRGDTVPRPLRSAIHGTHPNEILHMDYLYMGPGVDDKKYLLVLRDDLSSYVWLWSAGSCTSEHAEDALSNWIGAFGCPVWLISDRGSHFHNELIKSLTEELRLRHHFTTAYCPWANGSVERVCREVLRACKALLAEWRLAAQDWPTLTECIQSVLNHSPLKRLGLRSPQDSGSDTEDLSLSFGSVHRNAASTTPSACAACIAIQAST